MSEMPRGMQGQKAPGGAALARGVGRQAIGFPAPIGVVLDGLGGSFFSKVCFMKKKEGIPMRPCPILHLGSKVRDIAKEQGEGLMIVLLPFCERCLHLSLGVRDKFILRFLDQPHLQDLPALLLSQLRQGRGKVPIVGQPNDVVHKKDGLVVTCEVVLTLMENQANYPVSPIMDILTIV